MKNKIQKIKTNKVKKALLILKIFRILKHKKYLLVKFGNIFNGLMKNRHK
jgi:hypothetical protein